MGGCFHAFLISMGLGLPATFAADGPAGTWCSKNGSWRRGDYVAVPVDMLQAVVTARNLPDGTLALADREDHIAPMVKLSLYVAGATSQASRRAEVGGIPGRLSRQQCRGIMEPDAREQI